MTSAAESSRHKPRVDRRAGAAIPTMSRRSPKPNKNTTQPLWGQRFGAAAELPPGPELYATAGSTGDLVAGTLTSRAFNEAISSICQQPASERNRSARVAKGNPAE